MPSQPAPVLPPFAQATSGALGSAVSNTLVYPLDLLSTRMQTETRSSRARAAAAIASGQARKPTLLGALQDIHRKSGVKGLYKGWQSDTLSNTMSNFLFFYFRSFLIELVRRRKSAAAGGASSSKRKSVALSAAEDLSVGALAGILSRFFTTPLSNVTVRKQTSSKTIPRTPAQEKERQLTLEKKKASGKADEDATSSTDEETAYKDDAEDDGGPGIIDSLKEIMDERGVLGLWSGFDTAILLSIVPALTFYLTNFYTRVLLPARARGSPSALQTFGTSALGNASATLLVFPLILCKTRLQWKSPSGRRVYKNLADVLSKTVRKGGGWTALYQGLDSQLLKGLVGHGVTMMVKQRVERIFVLLFLLIRNRKVPALADV